MPATGGHAVPMTLTFGGDCPPFGRSFRSFPCSIFARLMVLALAGWEAERMGFLYEYKAFTNMY